MGLWTRVRNLDLLLVCRYEMRRQWRGSGRRGRLRWTLLAAALAAGVLFALDRWMPPFWSYVAAACLQPAGLGPSVPTVHDLSELPMWSISSGYILFSWGVFFLLLWMRVYVAEQVAGSVHRDRTSSQEEMMALSGLSERQVVLGKALAPVVPVAAVTAVGVLVLCPLALREGIPPLVLPRVWLEIVLQAAAVSGTCLGVASLFRRRGSVHLMSLLTSLVGVSAALWLHGWIVRSLAQGTWEGLQVTDHITVPWADTRCYWALLAAIAVIAFGLTRLRSGVPRRRWERLATALAGGAAALAGTLLPPRLLPPHPLHRTPLNPKQAAALNAAVDCIALRRGREALPLLEAAGGGVGPEEVRIARAAALFDAGEYGAAADACRLLRPVHLGGLGVGYYCSGMEACLVAGGRTRDAARFDRFWGRIVQSGLGAPGTPPPPPADLRAWAKHLEESLPAQNQEPYLPVRAVFLRWAVRSFPEDSGLRTRLGEQLAAWSRSRDAAERSYTPSLAARAALRAEAGGEKDLVRAVP